MTSVSTTTVTDPSSVNTESAGVEDAESSQGGKPTQLESGNDLTAEEEALLSPRPRAADTVYRYILHYRHRYPVHGTGYGSLFLNPCASVYTQLGQSCSAATRLSLHF